MIREVKIIAFDADDTLWINETYFRDSEERFFEMLAPYCDKLDMSTLLYETEMRNMPLYGYGIKAFTLSMIETALSIKNLPSTIIAEIISLGRDQLNKPVILLPGVVKTLELLYGKYELIVVTKGDFLDQERKLDLSGIGHYFHHVEVVSDKKENNYHSLLQHLDIAPEELLMIGNSIKSDILPPLALGCKAVYIPFETTWMHEVADLPKENKNCFQLQNMAELDKLLF